MSKTSNPEKARTSPSEHRSDAAHLLHVVSVLFLGHRNVLVHWKTRKVRKVRAAGIS